MNSGIFKLDLADMAKGLVLAVLGAVLTYVQQAIVNDTLDFSRLDWKTIAGVAAAAGIGYLIKNLLSTSDGKFLGKVGAVLLMLVLPALSGCAGVVDSISGRSAAGSGLAASAHKQGFACPDFTVQGSLQVANMTAGCSNSPTFGHTETFHSAGVDPNQALALAFQAQTAQNAQLMQALGQLLPLLSTAAGAAVGVPISPARPPAAKPPIVLVPPGGGAPVVIPQ